MDTKKLDTFEELSELDCLETYLDELLQAFWLLMEAMDEDTVAANKNAENWTPTILFRRFPLYYSVLHLLVRNLRNVHQDMKQNISRLYDIHFAEKHAREEQTREQTIP